MLLCFSLWLLLFFVKEEPYSSAAPHFVLESCPVFCRGGGERKNTHDGHEQRKKAQCPRPRHGNCHVERTACPASHK